MQAKPRAAVVIFPGSNGDRDLFETLERANFDVQYIRYDAALPESCHLVALPGGFSYGDYWRAGMLASQAPVMQALPEFISNGGLVIGICNGFQILVESGILPGALRNNEKPHFMHRWIDIEVDINASKSPWFDGIAPGTIMHLPMAHAEGNYFHADGTSGSTAIRAMRYTNNPNGSMADCAGIFDSTGQVLGLMPHPERAADPDLGGDDGLQLFVAAKRWLCRERL